MKKLISLLLLLIFLAGCTQPPPAQIAATTLPVYEFTTALCQGTELSVTRLVTESDSCLHDYSLNIRQVKAAESAQLLVISGGGLEDFLDGVTANAAAVLDSSQGISLKECGEAHDHEGHSHVHEADAHIWLSPENAMVMAENICTGLEGQYPQYTAVFRTNLDALLTRLAALQAYGDTQLEALSCRELVTFHDGFSYLAEAFGLTILEAVEEESGSEASARELKHLIGIVREHRLPAIFTEVNGSVSAADIIAAETGAKVFALDMAMSGDSWFDAMYHNIDTLKEALG